MIRKLLLVNIVLLVCASTYAQNTISLQPGATNGKDAWVWSYQPADNVNFGTANSSNGGLHNVVRAESWEWDTGVADTIRGLIEFDLSGIPANATIIDAKLSLYFFSNLNFTQQVGDNVMVIERIISNWSESAVTWNNQPQTTTANQILLPRSTSATQDYLDMDVTLLVSDMLQNANNSFGFMLKMQNETPFRGLSFASSDHTDATKHPKLEITYTVPVGTEEDNKKGDIRVFPNPTTDVLQVMHPTDAEELIVYDASGRVIYAVKPNFSLQTTIDVSHLPMGVYLLFIQTADETIRRKFAVERYN